MFSLMAQVAFDKVENIINKIEELHWSKSLSMWHTTNFKLKEALKMQSSGEFDSEDVRKDYDVPSADEWEKVRIVHRLVYSAHSVAKQVFETKHPTANKFLYNLLELREILVQESNSTDSFASEVAMNMLTRLDKYFKKSFLLLAVASVMDPRCKMQYIEYMSSKFQDDSIFKSDPVLEAIRNLYSYYVPKENEKQASNTKSEDDDSKTGGGGKFQNKAWLKEYSEFVQVNNKPQKSDLDLYLEDPVCDWSDDFNTLKWWRSQGPKYLVVAKMARDILAIPLSVATSYDAYYYLENWPPDLQLIRSGPELANALACCWSWSPRTIHDFDIWLLSQGISII